MRAEAPFGNRTDGECTKQPRRLTIDNSLVSIWQLKIYRHMTTARKQTGFDLAAATL